MPDWLVENVLVGSLLGILALILLDVIVKVAVCIKNGCFDWDLMLTFLRTNVVPFVLAYGGIEGLIYLSDLLHFPTGIVAPFVGMAAIIFALILARLVGSIIGSLRELGVPVVDEVRKDEVAEGE